MVAFDIGDEPRITETFTDFDGELTDPDSISCNVRTPSGVTTTYSYPSTQLSKISKGIYALDLPLTEAGDYRFKWNGTGACSQGFISVRRSLA